MEIALAIMSVVAIAYVVHNNKRICVTQYKIDNEKIDRQYKLVQLSDIHNDLFGKDNDHLVEATKNEQPDLIVLTGDLFDRRRMNIDRGIALVRRLKDISPVIFVCGNHEIKSHIYPKLKAELEKEKVTVLDNEHIIWNGIQICGLVDAFVYKKEERCIKLECELANHINTSLFSLLLSHEPQYFEQYSLYQYDLVLCGHAHGGQFRLPIIGGLYAPQQGILPKYTSGIHKDKGTTMIVSRGLGNSLFPFRLFNNPEVVSITLRKKS